MSHLLVIVASNDILIMILTSRMALSLAHISTEAQQFPFLAWNCIYLGIRHQKPWIILWEINKTMEKCPISP